MAYYRGRKWSTADRARAVVGDDAVDAHGVVDVGRGDRHSRVGRGVAGLHVFAEKLLLFCTHGGACMRRPSETAVFVKNPCAINITSG